MFKLVVVALLALSVVYGQQIAGTYNCASCKAAGGNWCSTNNACWRNFTVPTATCATASFYTDPSRCPAAVACSQIQYQEDSNLGVTAVTYTLNAGQFCVVNVTSEAADDIDVRVWGASNLVALRSNSTLWQAANITSYTNSSVTHQVLADVGSAAYLFWFNATTGSTSFTLETEGGYEVAECPE